jgi:uncharacterized repeat protein (TIGR01451 family)
MHIHKGAISTTNPSANFTLGVPYTVLPPGTIGYRIVETLGDTDFFDKPLQSDVSNVGPETAISLAVSIHNSGNSPAHKVTVRDSIPQVIEISTTQLTLFRALN